jgi:glucan biosynthesis protein C
MSRKCKNFCEVVLQLIRSSYTCAGTWFALNFRSGHEYVRERTRRLFISFVFGTLVIVPPQVYYRVISQVGETLSYIEFYPQFFIGVAPQRNFEWAHLWFLAYLITLSLTG